MKLYHLNYLSGDYYDNNGEHVGTFSDDAARDRAIEKLKVIEMIRPDGSKYKLYDGEFVRYESELNQILVEAEKLN